MQLHEGHVLEPAEHGGLVIRKFTTEGIDWRELLEKGTGRELTAEDYKRLREKGDFFWNFDSVKGPARYIRNLVPFDIKDENESAAP